MGKNLKFVFILIVYDYEQNTVLETLLFLKTVVEGQILVSI